MICQSDSNKWPATKYLLLAILFFTLLFARRYEQLLNPQVWDEDGTKILPALISEGGRSVFEPINGYLLVLPRSIALLSLSTSFAWYPVVSTVLAWLFIVAVAIAISISPTVLRGGAMLGIATMLVPSDAEVFGIDLYTFWWASLLIVVAALWREDAGGLRWRVAFVIVGGLSSPTILLAVPIFVLRTLYIRKRPEYAVAIVASLCAIAQLVVIKHNAPPVGPTALNLNHIMSVVPTFLGTYLCHNLLPYDELILSVFGSLTLLLVMFSILADRRNYRLYALCYLWLGSVVLIACRVPLEILSPTLGGPRYFFLPYVFEGWLLIQIAATARAATLRYCATAVVTLAIINAMPVLSRRHDDLRWHASVVACSQVEGSGMYTLPIQYDGNESSAWKLMLTGEECRSLVRSSFLP